MPETKPEAETETSKKIALLSLVFGMLKWALPAVLAAAGSMWSSYNDFRTAKLQAESGYKISVDRITKLEAEVEALKKKSELLKLDSFEPKTASYLGFAGAMPLSAEVLKKPALPSSPEPMPKNLEEAVKAVEALQ
jgi:hypothetical protein